MVYKKFMLVMVKELRPASCVIHIGAWTLHTGTRIIFDGGRFKDKLLDIVTGKLMIEGLSMGEVACFDYYYLRPHSVIVPIHSSEIIPPPVTIRDPRLVYPVVEAYEKQFGPPTTDALLNIFGLDLITLVDTLEEHNCTYDNLVNVWRTRNTHPINPFNKGV